MDSEEVGFAADRWSENAISRALQMTAIRARLHRISPPGHAERSEASVLGFGLPSTTRNGSVVHGDRSFAPLRMTWLIPSSGA